MRTYSIAEGTLLSALWWPKWEGNPKKKGYMYTYSWFTLLYSRNWHNTIKQLSSKKNFLKRKETMFHFSLLKSLPSPHPPPHRVPHNFRIGSKSSLQAPLQDCPALHTSHSANLYSLLFHSLHTTFLLLLFFSLFLDEQKLYIFLKCTTFVKMYHPLWNDSHHQIN